MAKSDLPEVLGILLCERVLQDVLRGNSLSLINIHNGMTVHGFPLIVPVVFAFAQLSGSHREFTYQFRVVDRSGNILTVSPAAPVDPLPNKHMTHKVISAFSNLLFREEGTYQVILAIDGHDAGHLHFQVVQVPPESGPGLAG